MLKTLSQKILDILFPISCVGCGIMQVVLCDTCIEKRIYTQAYNNTGVISILNYKDEIVKEVIWKFKYTGNRKIGLIFGQILYDRILEDISEQGIFSNFNNPLLISIPLSKKRLRERGFNQSELIARAMSTIDNDESFSLALNVLYKIKDTLSQARIKDKTQRLQNLNGCFAVKDKNLVFGKNIILIDDVTTTGATIKEATKALHSAGARQIIAFTVAH